MEHEMGATGKYTEKIKTLIFAAIERGLSYKDTCKLVGISQKTFYNWMDAKPGFKERVEHNQIHGKLQLIRAVAEKRLDDWRAAAWLLSHKYPAEFSERRTISTDTEEKKPTPWELMNEVIKTGEPIVSSKEDNESKTDPA